MSFPLDSRKAMLVFTLAALPFVVGSSCAVFWSSGSGTSERRDREEEDEGFVVIKGGQFGNPPVAGLEYESGSVSGITGENGEFNYEPGKTVQFSVGDIKLGQPVTADPDMSVGDLVRGASATETTEVNIRRLLQSLDAEPGDEVITIPAEVRSSAIMSNETVAPSLEFLDFTDDDAFANTASQLVAVLTHDYPFTAMLVEADEVAQSPTRSVAR
jgi:hypothetical protein